MTKVTSTLRSGFAKVYASYLINMISGAILPKAVCKIMVETFTLPPTLAFSNVPGPLQKISYKGSETLFSSCGLICGGRCGIAVGVLSYAGEISFSIVSDTGVLEDSHRLTSHMEKAIKEYIELGKKVKKTEKEK